MNPYRVIVLASFALLLLFSTNLSAQESDLGTKWVRSSVMDNAFSIEFPSDCSPSTSGCAGSPEGLIHGVTVGASPAPDIKIPHADPSDIDSLAVDYPQIDVESFVAGAEAKEVKHIGPGEWQLEKTRMVWAGNSFVIQGKRFLSMFYFFRLNNKIIDLHCYGNTSDRAACDRIAKSVKM